MAELRPCKECSKLCYSSRCKSCWLKGRRSNPARRRYKNRYKREHYEKKFREPKQYKYNVLKHLS